MKSQGKKLHPEEGKYLRQNLVNFNKRIIKSFGRNELKGLTKDEREILEHSDTSHDRYKKALKEINEQHLKGTTKGKGRQEMYLIDLWEFDQLGLVREERTSTKGMRDCIQSFSSTIEKQETLKSQKKAFRNIQKEVNKFLENKSLDEEGCKYLVKLMKNLQKRMPSTDDWKAEQSWIREQIERAKGKKDELQEEKSASIFEKNPKVAKGQRGPLSPDKEIDVLDNIANSFLVACVSSNDLSRRRSPFEDFKKRFNTAFERTDLDYNKLLELLKRVKGIIEEDNTDKENWTAQLLWIEQKIKEVEDKTP